MKLQKKAIIFDLDGVICFTDKYHYLAWKALADRLGISLPDAIGEKIDANSAKYPVEKSRGSARKYTEL